MAVPNYDLGQTNTLSQHSFEVEWPLSTPRQAANGDADPAQCVDLFLNSTVFGALIGGAPMELDNLSRRRRRQPAMRHSRPIARRWASASRRCSTAKSQAWIS
jgi:hypothetical protein